MVDCHRATGLLTNSWRLGWTSPSYHRQAPSLAMWWLQTCVLLLLLPSMWGGLGSSQGTPVVGKQMLGAEGRVLLLGRSASFICFGGKEWPLWNGTRADPAGKIHKSWALLVQINGNHHNFTFHAGATQSFYCAAKAIHQQTQDYHRPPQKSHLEHSIQLSSRLHRLHPKF